MPKKMAQSIKALKVAGVQESEAEDNHTAIFIIVAAAAAVVVGASLVAYALKARNATKRADAEDNTSGPTSGNNSQEGKAAAAGKEGKDAKGAKTQHTRIQPFDVL